VESARARPRSGPSIAPVPLADVSRVLCLAAHPDDLDFGAAGTVAGWAAAGLEVTFLLCTRGEQGGFDDEDVVAMRLNPPTIPLC